MQLRRLIRTNPVGEFRIQVRHKDAVRTLPSPFELMRLLGSVRAHYQQLLTLRKAHKFSLFIQRRDLCIFSLCVACGLRRAELRRIQIADVDFERFMIRVAGKGAGRFTIRERLAFFSHPFLQQVLHRYWKMREALPGSFLFCNWVGDPMMDKSIDDIFKTYNSFLRPPAPYNPTVLRKAFCTRLVHRKVNIAAIQVLMGHEKCETTLQYYVQLSPEQLEQTWKETTPYARALHGPFTRMIFCQLPQARRGLPVESLPVSQIPQPLIHDCMRLSCTFSFRIGRRFLTFLIHAGCLDASLLPTRSTVLLRAIAQAPTELDPHLSLQQAGEAFVKHLSQHTCLLSGALSVRYTHLRMFARWKDPHSSLASVRRQHIRDYLGWLQDTRHYRAVFRAGVLSELRAFFAYFVTTGLLKSNPTKGFRVKKPRKQPPTALNEEQLTAVSSRAPASTGSIGGTSRTT